MPAETTDAFMEGVSHHKRIIRQNPCQALSARSLCFDFPQNDLICHPRRHLGNVDHLIAVETKAFDDLEIDTLISQESHRGVVSKG